jgi:very-short-patch-repair endonuclease
MPRLRFRDKRSPSRLEERFLMLWKLAEGPDLEREYRFDSKRRWRADFAHLEARCLIEVEGGIWVNGRHNRAAGFNADLEKYLEAALAGWRVFRLGPDQITVKNVARLIEMVKAIMAPVSAATLHGATDAKCRFSKLVHQRTVKKVESAKTSLHGICLGVRLP